MSTTTILCDNCKNAMTSGFELTNIGERRMTYVSRPAQFCLLNCIALWADKAARASKRLEETARSLNPHGTFVSDDAPGLAVG